MTRLTLTKRTRSIIVDDPKKQVYDSYEYGNHDYHKGDRLWINGEDNIFTFISYTVKDSGPIYITCQETCPGPRPMWPIYRYFKPERLMTSQPKQKVKDPYRISETMNDKAKRNGFIIIDRRNGMSYADLSTNYNMSTGGISVIIAKAKKAGLLS